MIKRQSGFTLLEIIVVITIIAILAAYIAPKVAGRADDARISKVKNDIQVLESALELYRLDNFTYPTTEQGLQALVTQPSDEVKNWKAGGYVKKLRKDPWGNEYHYAKPGRDGAEIEIYSYGADGKEGGTGSDADIGSWNIDTL
jgi:general secretion pathway protein G